MKRILMATVATIILLWSTTPITAQASLILQTRSFRTNLVKGEFVDEEVLDPEKSVDDGLDDEIEEPEPQESDEHTDDPHQPI